MIATEDTIMHVSIVKSMILYAAVVWWTKVKRSTARKKLSYGVNFYDYFGS